MDWLLDWVKNIPGVMIVKVVVILAVSFIAGLLGFHRKK